MKCTEQESPTAVETSPGLTAPEGKPRRWSEKLGDTLFEFVGDPASTATRKVVAIHSLTPLVKRQKAARIPSTYHGALLATWDEDKANPGVSEIVQGYIQRPDRSLYLCGSVGVGKTWAACTIANELLQRGSSGRPARSSKSSASVSHCMEGGCAASVMPSQYGSVWEIKNTKPRTSRGSTSPGFSKGPAPP